MAKKEKIFDPNRLLSNNLVIKKAGSHLYLIGLSLTQFGSQKRHRFYNPKFVLFINLLLVMRCIISILSNDDNRNLFIIIGDYSYFFKVRFHYNIALAMYVILAIISQLIYYRSSHKKISLTFLKPFEMMVGLVSPFSINLDNEEDIRKMIKKTKLIFSISELNIKIFVPIAGFIVSFFPYVMHCSLKEIIFFGIPWSILFTICIHFACNIQIWQITYFYLICYYMKIRVYNLNNSNKSKMKQKCKISNRSINSMLAAFNSIYNQINEYNITFWSKYLF
jgi:hypothetical protein